MTNNKNKINWKKVNLYFFSKDILFGLKTRIALFVLILIFIFHPILLEGLLKVLPNTNVYSSEILDRCLIIFCLYIIGFFAYKVFYHKYKTSYSQRLIYFSIIFFYVLARLNSQNLSLEFYTFQSPILDNCYYADFIFFSLLTFPIFNLFSPNWLSQFYVSEKTNSNKYLDDKPKDIQSNEELSQLSLRIVDLIKNDWYDTSFSIGVIGPWGYGKTSFMDEVKFGLRNETNILTVNFSPFLNHKEEDVITEFFTSLSSQLRPYSGKLSNSIHNYALSITNVYNKGDFSDIIKNNIIKQDESAQDLYLTIDNQIKEIGKKIVVYIDDLDRLNVNEILQVFKLIRNTSKFSNTFFVVAFDKEYVINSLIKDVSSNRSFIEKFFQLEVFLTEIPEVDLINFVTDELTLRFPDNKNKFEEINVFLQRGIKHNFFNKYITNYRDANKLINQILFDLNVFSDLLNEIDFQDYLNINYLKLKFSKIYDELLSKTLNILEYDRVKNIYFYSGKIQNVNKLGISQLIKNDAKELKQPLTILEERVEFKKDILLSKIELALLIETISSIFNKINRTTKSINTSRNFSIIKRLKLGESDLSGDDFKSFLSMKSFDEQSEKKVIKLILDNKWYQFMGMLNEYKPKSKSELILMVELLFFFWLNQHKYSLYDYDLETSLSSLLDEKYNDKKFDSNVRLSKEESILIVEKCFFENSNTSVVDKLFLINYLIENNISGLWGFSKDAFNEKGIRYFKELVVLELENNKMYSDLGPSLKNEFKRLSKFISKDDLKNAFFSCLNPEIIEGLIFELIEPVQNHYAHYYKLNHNLLEIFDSDIFLILENLEKHRNDSNYQILEEFISFSMLCSKINFKALKWGFKIININPLNYFKLEQIENSKGVVQLIFEYDESLRDFKPSEVPDIIFQEWTIGHNPNKYHIITVSTKEDNLLVRNYFDIICKQLTKTYNNPKRIFSVPINTELVTSSILESESLRVVILIHKA